MSRLIFIHLKTMRILLFAFISMLFLLTSCSSRVEVNDLPDTSEYYQSSIRQNSELLAVNARIDSLNNVTFNTNVVESRAFFGFFKKFLAVTVADAVGGLFGSLIGPVGTAAGAIAASGCAAILPTKNIGTISRSSDSPSGDSGFLPTNSRDLAMKDLVPPGLEGGLVTSEDSIGYYHNKVLLDLKEYDDSIGLNRDVILEKVSLATSECYNYNVEAIRSSLQSNGQVYDKIANGDFSGDRFDNLHALFDAWKTQYPEKYCELTILETVFNGISQLDVTENDGTYLSQILDIVDNSILDDISKQNLRNAFIVGNASFQLWNVSE